MFYYFQVIPVERTFVNGEKDETWSLASDQPFKDNNNVDDCHDDNKINNNKKDDEEEFVDALDICRGQEGRQSRTKKVKNYLRKCKGALTSSGSSTSRDDSTNSRTINRNKNIQYNKNNKKINNNRSSSASSSSWYIDDKKIETIDINSIKLDKLNTNKKIIVRTTSLTRNIDDNNNKKKLIKSPKKFGSESLLDSIDNNDLSNELSNIKITSSIDNNSQNINNNNQVNYNPIKNDKNNDNNDIKNQKIIPVYQHQLNVSIFCIFCCFFFKL